MPRTRSHQESTVSGPAAAAASHGPGRLIHSESTGPGTVTGCRRRRLLEKAPPRPPSAQAGGTGGAPRPAQSFLIRVTPAHWGPAPGGLGSGRRRGDSDQACAGGTRIRPAPGGLGSGGSTAGAVTARAPLPPGGPGAGGGPRAAGSGEGGHDLDDSEAEGLPVGARDGHVLGAAGGAEVGQGRVEDLRLAGEGGEPLRAAGARLRVGRFGSKPEMSAT